LEVSLTIVIIALIFSLKSIYGVTEENIEQSMKEMFVEYTKNNLGGQCFEDLDYLIESEKRKDYEGIIEQGNALLINGYENDKYLLRTIALAYYKKSNKNKAIELYLQSFKGTISCEALRLNNDTYIYFDDAITHYVLSMIYREIGADEKSEDEKEKSIALSELFYKLNEKNGGPEIIIGYAENMLKK
jgi:tetratricopeptide (TPR) repeat protein